MADMTYRRLGSSGLAVSTVGLGCNNFGGRIDAAQVDAVVGAALDAGINLFDTADSYGNGVSETLLGKALGKRRDDAIVATKFGLPVGDLNGADWGARGSRRYVRKAVESSLQRLGTDYIDLYQFHKPDPLTPIEETLSALDDLVREGKVRYLGFSQASAWQIVDADWVAKSHGYEAFVSVQKEYSWLNRDIEAEVVPALEHIGVGLLPFYPLSSGLLTGKYRRGQQAPEGSRMAAGYFAPQLEKANFDVIEALEAFASDRGLTLLQVAIGGLAAMPTVGSVIAGATSVQQINDNVAAGLWEPTEEEVATLLDITA